MKKICLIFIYTLFRIVSPAQIADEHYYFKNLSIGNGLSQNTVNAILQDKKGFMWFGTKDGLNRYDGLSFRHYKACADNGSCSIGNNFITWLHEDTNDNLWIGTDTGVYIYNPESETFSHFIQPSTNGIVIERSISAIYENDRNIWIAVESQGLFCYNLDTRSLTNYLSGSIRNISSVLVDNSGTIWIGFYGGGLSYSKDNLQTLIPFLTADEKKEIFQDDIVTRILKGSYNCLYVGSNKGGVKEMNLTSGKVRDILLYDEKGDPVYFRDMILNTDTELWIGTESGIFIYNLKTNQFIHLHHSAYDPYSLSDNAVYSIYKDKEEGIWIGSYFGGVDYYPKQYTYFEKYYPTNDPHGIQGKRVREFCEDPDGNLWVGTEDGGLNHFNIQTKEFRFYAPSSSFTNVHGLCMDGDNLWVGTFSKGLKRINTRTGELLKSYTKNETSHSLFDNSIFSICKTSTGDIFLGTLFGLNVYNKEVDGFDRIPELDGCFVYDIKEDSYGNLWLATYANGAFCYDVSEKQWKNYTYDADDDSSLPYDKVLSIFEDSRRQVWLTTQGGGFCRFDPETQSFERFNSLHGLINNVVYQMIEDNDGFLWLTTNNGLVRFDAVTRDMKVYTTANGLLCDQFSYRSGFKDKEGNIYVGSINGFVKFNPHTFSRNSYIPPVRITDFYLHGKNVVINKADSPLKKSISYSDRITLSSRQNSFSFRIAALSYQAPRMNKLMYKLDGFDNDWITAGESRAITYSNLKYGEYVFRVRASNNDGIWNEQETTLDICILPPFYLTIWAYCAYSLLSAGLLLYIVLSFRRKTIIRQRRQMEAFEYDKEREIYNAKIEFFTNVAHEIRTPLTLIKGPLENIILKNKVDPETKEDLGIMKQNTERLLSLTNQLLDFRNTESEGFRLNFVECNVSETLRETYLRFTPLVKQKGLQIMIDMPENDFSAHVNKEAFIKIISNLLNNAVKYAATYIRLSLEVDMDNSCFFVRTKNDGTLVPSDMMEHIFKPFVRYQENDAEGSTGTGIGLALARSLAELHQGSLYMERQDGANCFCLMLPVIQDSVIRMEASLSVDLKIRQETKAEADIQKESKPTILIVEDNPDMLAFIVRQFDADYIVKKAMNGKEALDVLDSNFVNLVITDIVMPQMDGFELCKTIKSDLNYSHIPVILLTAKTNIQSKIEGLEFGADAYIEKPFSVEFLSASVSNLISCRQKLLQTFSQSPFVGANTMALTKADEEFLRKLNEIIHAHLHDPDFSMDDMADALHMSRSNFYRKIKGILNLSPNEYLRLERLKKAAQLLKEGESRVNEVCYTVGFNSPSYFSKCFHKQFGVLPKEFTE